MTSAILFSFTMEKNGMFNQISHHGHSPFFYDERHALFLPSWMHKQCIHAGFIPCIEY